MAKLEWNNIDEKLSQDLENILAEYIPMDNLEKREIIYNYIVDNFKYEEAGKKPSSELVKTVFEHTGSFHDLAMYYKLLLEKANIPAYYVTYLGEDKKIYGFNLIYNEDNKTFSFDDVTLGIINKDKHNYFNYDITKAHQFKQGIVKDKNNCYMNLIEEEYFHLYLFKKLKPKTDIVKLLIKKREKAKKYLNNNKIELELVFEDNEKRKGSR